MSKCPNAKPTDEYHGWECEITGGECLFLYPNFEACKSLYLDYEDDMEANSNDA